VSVSNLRFDDMVVVLLFWLLLQEAQLTELDSQWLWTRIREGMTLYAPAARLPDDLPRWDFADMLWSLRIDAQMLLGLSRAQLAALGLTNARALHLLTTEIGAHRSAAARGAAPPATGRILAEMSLRHRGHGTEICCTDAPDDTLCPGDWPTLLLAFDNLQAARFRGWEESRLFVSKFQPNFQERADAILAIRFHDFRDPGIKEAISFPNLQLLVLMGVNPLPDLSTFLGRRPNLIIHISDIGGVSELRRQLQRYSGDFGLGHQLRLTLRMTPPKGAAVALLRVLAGLAAAVELDFTAPPGLLPALDTISEQGQWLALLASDRVRGLGKLFDLVIDLRHVVHHLEASDLLAHLHTRRSYHSISARKTLSASPTPLRHSVASASASAVNARHRSPSGQLYDAADHEDWDQGLPCPCGEVTAETLSRLPIRGLVCRLHSSMPNSYALIRPSAVTANGVQLERVRCESVRWLRSLLSNRSLASVHLHAESGAVWCTALVRLRRLLANASSSLTSVTVDLRQSNDMPYVLNLHFSEENHLPPHVPLPATRYGALRETDAKATRHLPARAAARAPIGGPDPWLPLPPLLHTFYFLLPSTQLFDVDAPENLKKKTFEDSGPESLLPMFERRGLMNVAHWPARARCVIAANLRHRGAVLTTSPLLAFQRANRGHPFKDSVLPLLDDIISLAREDGYRGRPIHRPSRVTLSKFLGSAFARSQTYSTPPPASTSASASAAAVVVDMSKSASETVANASSLATSSSAVISPDATSFTPAAATTANAVAAVAVASAVAADSSGSRSAVQSGSTHLARPFRKRKLPPMRFH
jgi:hypothetical protein